MKICQAILCASIIGVVPAAAGPICGDQYVPMKDSVNAGFLRVKVAPGCPSSKYDRPENLSWHFSYGNVSEVELTETANGLLTPMVEANILTFQFQEDFTDGETVRYGAEVVIPSQASTVTTLEVDGTGESVYFDDSEGSLSAIVVRGRENFVQVKSTSSFIQIVVEGYGDALRLEASNADVTVETQDTTGENDLKIKCASIQGTIGGYSNKVLVDGEVSKLKEKGIENRVIVGGEGSCDNVDTDWSNKCSETDDTVQVVSLSCLPESGKADYCSSTPSKNGYGLLIGLVAATTAFVAYHSV